MDEDHYGITFDADGFKLEMPLIVLRHMKDCKDEKANFKYEMYDKISPEAKFKFTGIPGDNYCVEVQFKSNLVTLKSVLQAQTFDNFYKVAVNAFKNVVRYEINHLSNWEDFSINEDAEELIESMSGGNMPFYGCYGPDFNFSKNNSVIIDSYHIDFFNKFTRDLPFLNYPEDDFEIY